MKVNRKKLANVLLVVVIIAFSLWMTIISVMVLNLWDAQLVDVECISTLQRGMNDLYDRVFDITIDPQVIPYFIIKKERAMLGIECIGSTDERNFIIIDEMRKLNKRGRE